MILDKLLSNKKIFIFNYLMYNNYLFIIKIILIND